MLKAVLCLVVAAVAAYGAGAAHNQPFQVFCGFAAIFGFIAAVISFMDDLDN